jgi:cytochrome P450
MPFLNEVLRLYPSNAQTDRRNLKPELIEGVLVPAGTRFRMNIALVHHPKYWDEPESCRRCTVREQHKTGDNVCGSKQQ